MGKLTGGSGAHPVAEVEKNAMKDDATKQKAEVQTAGAASSLLRFHNSHLLWLFATMEEIVSGAMQQGGTFQAYSRTDTFNRETPTANEL